ncbi:hypothetical protein F5Y08DRAFT_56754 [Xylaria arbuscula]|nr:hypothetical protein F5Y08DRAFT_56754 [Xylaria arbuscula]
MLSQTLEEHDLTELVRCAREVCYIWLWYTLVLIQLLVATWAWSTIPFILLDIKIVSGCFGRSAWEPFSNGFCLWLLFALLGIWIDSIFFTGWLWLRIIRGRQNEEADYRSLGINVFWAIEIIVLGYIETFMFLVDALLPRRGPRQEREDVFERVRRTGRAYRRVGGTL